MSKKVGTKVGTETQDIEIVRVEMNDVCASTPAKRKKMEAVLNGTNTNTKAEAVPSKLVTISEAARILNVCRATIHKLADAGRLDKVTLINRSRITMKSIIDYTSGNR